MGPAQIQHLPSHLYPQLVFGFCFLFPVRRHEKSSCTISPQDWEGRNVLFCLTYQYNVVPAPDHIQAVLKSGFEQDVQIQTVANPMGRRVDSEENKSW